MCDHYCEPTISSSYATRRPPAVSTTCRKVVTTADRPDTAPTIVQQNLTERAPPFTGPARAQENPGGPAETVEFDGCGGSPRAGTRFRRRLGPRAARVRDVARGKMSRVGGLCCASGTLDKRASLLARRPQGLEVPWMGMRSPILGTDGVSRHMSVQSSRAALLSCRSARRLPSVASGLEHGSSGHDKSKTRVWRPNAVGEKASVGEQTQGVLARTSKPPSTHTPSRTSRAVRPA